MREAEAALLGDASSMNDARRMVLTGDALRMVLTGVYSGPPSLRDLRQV